MAANSIKVRAAELTTEIIKEFYRETDLRRTTGAGEHIASNFETVYNKILELLNKD